MTSKSKPVNAAASPLSRPCLYPWDSGHAVSEMQELLCAHGFWVRVDGDYGWRTEVAVKAYQKKCGFRVDGIVGPKMWVSLTTTVQPGARVLRRGHIGGDVHQLQRLLGLHGHSVQTDGVFGDETHTALVTFQTHHGLPHHGWATPPTWAALEATAPAASSLPAPTAPSRSRSLRATYRLEQLWQLVTVR